MNDTDLLDIYLQAMAWGVYELPEVISTDCTAELHSDPIRCSNAAYHREWLNDNLWRTLDKYNYIFALPPEGVTRRLDKPADQCMTYSPALRTYNDSRGYERILNCYWLYSNDWRGGYVVDDILHYYWAQLPDRPTYDRPHYHIATGLSSGHTFEYTPGVRND